MDSTGTHKCPYPGCDKEVWDNQIMCRPHWFQVPKEMRQRVWSEYRKGPRSIAHARAVQDAIASVQ